MTVVCPSGHRSTTTDYCDQCGAPMPGIAAPRVTEVLPVVEEADTSPASLREPCPVCHTRRSGDDRYCESCGHDFLAPPPTPTAWEAVATPDRALFERYRTPGLSFPSALVERRFALDAASMRIGRSRGSAGESTLEIDLAGSPEDPGISRLHAVLERQADGSYAVRDLGSTNGTTVNDDPDPIGTHAAQPLVDGDRIRVGAWTTVTVRAR